MRNLMQYPITVDECERLLDSVKADLYKQEAFGDTRGICISYIAEFLELNEEQFSEFLKTKEIK